MKNLIDKEEEKEQVGTKIPADLFEGQGVK